MNVKPELLVSKGLRLSPVSGVATGGLDGALYRNPEAQGALGT